MNLSKLIQALRPINILMAVFILLSIRYGILHDAAYTDEKNAVWFPLYIIALVCLMCFGYLINDYYDIETDSINKPGKNVFGNIPSLPAKTIMWFSAAVGLIIPIIGFLKNYHFAFTLFIYVLAAVLLFLYARYLKNSIFIGNLIIAILAGLTVFVPCHIGLSFNADARFLITAYGLFAFLVTLVREIVKDAQDIEGDFKSHINTLATKNGTKVSVYFSSVLMLITMLVLVACGFHFFQLRNNTKAVVFLILVISGFLPFFKIVRATDKKHFSQASIFLKIWMLLGIMTMWI